MATQLSVSWHSSGIMADATTVAVARETGNVEAAPPPAAGHARVMHMGATLLSSTLGNLATILVTAWLVRTLGTEAFGRVAILSGAATALGNVTAAGVALYVVRTLSVAQQEAPTRVAAAAMAGQIFAGLLTLAGLGITLLGSPLLGWYDLALAACALHCITADMHAKNCLIGHQKVVALALATLAGALLCALSQFVGARYWGPQGYLAGFAIGTAMQLSCSHLMLRKVTSPEPIGNWSQRWRLLQEAEFMRFVLPATLSASLVPAAHWCANLIAAAKAGRYSEVAILTVAMQFFNIVIFVPTVLNKIVLPRTIRAYSSGQSQAETRSHALRQSALLFGIAIPAPVIVWLFAGPVQSLYQFSEPNAMTAIYAFCTAAAFACAGIPISNYVVSHQKMAFGLMTNVFWSSSYLLLAWLLPGSAIAVGAALLVAYMLTLLLAVTPLYSRH